MDGPHWAVSIRSDALGLLAFISPALFFRTLVSVPNVLGDWWRNLE